MLAAGHVPPEHDTSAGRAGGGYVDDLVVHVVRMSQTHCSIVVANLQPIGVTAIVARVATRRPK
jgi:hypothetical protein